MQQQNQSFDASLSYNQVLLLHFVVDERFCSLYEPYDVLEDVQSFICILNGLQRSLYTQQFIVKLY